MIQKEIKHYTDAFKKMVLDELENSNSSYAKISQKYKIGGSMTLKRWILASGRNNLLYKIVLIGAKDEIL